MQQQSPDAEPKAVVFDAFGTLVRLGARRRPYRQLQELMAKYGRPAKIDDAVLMMSANVGPIGLAKQLGLNIPLADFASIETDLHHELTTISLFEDALCTIALLRKRGFKLALCSNLASPYSVPVRHLLPSLDVYVLSCELGVVKPNPFIYEHLCRTLGCEAPEVVFVGDTYDADVDGPRRHGMRGVLIDREGCRGDSTAIRSLNELPGVLGVNSR